MKKHLKTCILFLYKKLLKIKPRALPSLNLPVKSIPSGSQVAASLFFFHVSQEFCGKCINLKYLCLFCSVFVQCLAASQEISSVYGPQTRDA